MVGAPRNASLDGLSAGAKPASGSPAPAMRSARLAPYRRTREMFQLLRLMALAVVALVCAGSATPARAPSPRTSALEVVIESGAVRSALALSSAPLHQWKEGSSQPVIDLRAVEADLEDDDGHRHDGQAPDATPTLRGVAFLGSAGTALRSQPQVDTSRFAARPGLPRGPPAA